MAHNLMNRNGTDAMFVVGDRDAAWHHLGQRTPNAVNWQDAMKLADLDWTVIKKQLWARNPANKVVEVPSFGLFRSDDSAYLGTVRGRYTPIQNKHAFEFVDGLLEATNGAHYDSAGALGNGERVWCAAKVPFDFVIDGGDRHETYLLFTTSHDGSESAECKLTTVRVVCQNTLAQALNEVGAAMKFRHTASARERMVKSVELMRGVGSSVQALRNKLARLAEVKMTREATEKLLDRLFPRVEGQNQGKREERVSEVLALYERADGNAFPSVTGSAYNMLNAVTEYADHFKMVRASAGEDRQRVRAASALFGGGDGMKRQTLEFLMEFAADSALG